MEKEIDKKNLVLREDESIGTVQIADDVVAMIASLAATEVDGVSAMAGNVTNELMSKVGVRSLTKGVKVEVLDNNVTVDLTVTMEYGYNIPATCQAVQQEQCLLRHAYAQHQLVVRIFPRMSAAKPLKCFYCAHIIPYKQKIKRRCTDYPIF